MKDNWNPNDWQGRSRRQVQNNETLAMVSVVGIILTVVIAAIVNML
jgi:uncharacterized membrane protein YidH (DUF202 family)